MDLIHNAWEFGENEDGLLKLTGHTTREEYEQDRRVHAAEIVEFCRITPESRGFEVGSGDGTVARLLAHQCGSLDCNDISSSFLNMARAASAHHPNLTVHRIENYLDHLPSESYDFGFSLHVFIHFNVYDIYNYLASAKRILKPGGFFYFDACSLGEQTLPGFLEHTQMYARSPETIRGLLNFNHPETIRQVVQLVGLEMSNDVRFMHGGWMKTLTRKPAASSRSKLRLVRGSS
jgi:SAM-dependent methyltransferase